MVTAAAVAMMYFQIQELFYIKDFYAKSTDRKGPLFIVLGVLTNLPTAAGFGKPYAPSMIGIIGFIVSVFVCLGVSGLWGWCERFMVAVLPLAVGVQFFWLRHTARTG